MQNALFHTAHAVSEILASQGKLSVFVIVDCISLSLRYTVLLFEIKLKKKRKKSLYSFSLLVKKNLCLVTYWKMINTYMNEKYLIKHCRETFSTDFLCMTLFIYDLTIQ